MRRPSCVEGVGARSSLTVHLQDGSDHPGQLFGLLGQRARSPQAFLVTGGSSLRGRPHFQVPRAGFKKQKNRRKSFPKFSDILGLVTLLSTLSREGKLR